MHFVFGIWKEFQKKYPNIDYELLMGNYEEIENWILEGRVDCGFTRIPANEKLDIFPIEKDELRVILLEDHPLAAYEKIPVQELASYPFLLLEKDNNKVVSEIFEENALEPHIHVTTWDDYAIMSMVERGFGISILPELILKRTDRKSVV